MASISLDADCTGCCDFGEVMWPCVYDLTILRSGEFEADFGEIAKGCYQSGLPKLSYARLDSLSSKLASDGTIL